LAPQPFQHVLAYVCEIHMKRDGSVVLSEQQEREKNIGISDPFRGTPIPAKGTRMRGAKAVIETMKAYGTDYFFGIPGSTIPLFAEFAGRNDVKLILTRDERGAACMADGYARISHKPGLCTAVEGPGTTNLLTGIGEAWMSSVPVIAITAARTPTESAKNPIMFCRGRVYDTFDVLKPYTKWSIQVHHPARVAELIGRAYTIATTGRPGPVQVELYPDAMYQEWEYNIAGDREYSVWPAQRSWPDPSKLRAAAELLVEAKRPVIISGGGVVHGGAWDELIALAEHLSIPVATSLFGKGSIPERHSLAVGVCGIHPRLSANQTVADADLVLFVGSNTDMHTTNKWTNPAPGEVTVIHIDIDPEEIGRNYPTTVGIVSDAKTGLAGLLEAVKTLVPRKRHLPEVYDRVARRVNAWREKIRPDQLSDATPIKPQRLMHEISQFLRPDAIVLGDLSFSSIWVDVHYDCPIPGPNVTYARGFDLLGWGLPASLGAQLAAPGRQVLSLTGDGSLGYCIGELETAARYNIPAVNVVLNNSTLGYEKFLIKYYNQPGKITPMQPGCDYGPVDWAAVARGFGCVGIRVEHPSQIRPALEEAFASRRPALIDVIIDAEVIPPSTFFAEDIRSA
jgi:acetolactate synthase-1/2/3 large subunit